MRISSLRKSTRRLRLTAFQLKFGPFDRLLDAISARILGRPFDFDAFLENNPGIKAANINPRIFVGWEFAKSLVSFRPISKKLLNEIKALSISGENKPAALVVTHQSTLTGAPIVALEITKSLSETHSVIVVSLSPGPLDSEFRERARVFVSIPNFHIPFHSNTLQKLSKLSNLQVAIFNSIESRPMLQQLSRLKTRKILLIHEFLTQAKPKDQVLQALNQADSLVFSSALLESQLDQMGLQPRQVELIRNKVLIVPQPPSSIKISDGPLVAKGLRKSDFLLGAGTVEFRKGVDLFVAVARKVLQRDSSLKFIWIGSGFRPDHDPYSTLLQEQIRQAELGGGLSLLDAVSREDYLRLLSKSRGLVLTSRLDPLPNVALEALALGKPVFFFKGTTGLTEFLNQEDLNALQADTFDIGDLADLIMNFKKKNWPSVRLSERIDRPYRDYVNEIIGRT